MIDIPTCKTVRILRILYPIWVIVGIFSMMYVQSTFWVAGNEIQTITNVEDNEIIFRMGIIGNILTQILHVIIPFYLYILFIDTDKNWATLMLILALISVPMTLSNEINQLRVLDLLDTPIEAFQFLKEYNHGINISSLFWGLWLFPLGCLVIESKLFPKILGIFLYVGGLGYFLGGLLRIFIPTFKSLNPILEVMIFGELIFIIWFVIKGVKTNAE